MDKFRSMPPSVKGYNLSSRFAMDEIDASDIGHLVNESYSIECLPGGDYQFRHPGLKINVDEVLQSIIFSFKSVI